MEKFTATKVGHGYHAIDSEKSSPPKPSQVPASSAPVTSPPTIAPPVQTKPQEPQLPPHYYEEDAEKEGCCRKCVRHRIRHKCSVALVLSIFLFVLSLLGTGSSIYVILKKTCWLKYDLSTSGSEDCVDYETMPFPYPWYMVIGATCASGLTAIVLLFITIFSCWKKCFRASGCLLALVACAGVCGAAVFCGYYLVSPLLNEKFLIGISYWVLLGSCGVDLAMLIGLMYLLFESICCPSLSGED